jgi:hypothetical protein
LAESGIKNRDNLIIEGKLAEVSTKAEEVKKEEAPKEDSMKKPPIDSIKIKT